jgi:hypothetical protein
MHTEKHIRAHPVRLVAAATAETEWGTGSCAFMHACMCMCMCVYVYVYVCVCESVCGRDRHGLRTFANVVGEEDNVGIGACSCKLRRGCFYARRVRQAVIVPPHTRTLTVHTEGGRVYE